MQKIKRQGIIIWLYTLKQVNQLKRLGYIHYVSDRMKYAVMYVDQTITPRIVEQLKGLHFVREVELSNMDDVDMTFQNALSAQPQIKSDDEDNNFFKEIAQQIKETQILD